MQPTSSQSEKDPIPRIRARLGCHVCGFFRNSDEEYGLLLPFIKEGFMRGEKAFHVVNPNSRDDQIGRLASAGIDVAGAQQNGQFEFCDWDQAYFPEGRFDQDRMLAMWQDVLDSPVQHGFPLTRLVAHMEWTLVEREGVSDLLEYGRASTRFITAIATRSFAPTISPGSGAT